MNYEFLFPDSYKKGKSWTMPEMNNILQIHVKLSKEVSFEWSLFIIPQARMGSESIAHEGERNNIVLVKSN